MKTYSVALVFRKQTPTTVDTALRMMHARAESEEAALGFALREVWGSPDLKDYNLQLQAVLTVIKE